MESLSLSGKTPEMLEYCPQNTHQYWYQFIHKKPNSTNKEVAQPSTSTANQVPDPTLQNTDDTASPDSNNEIQPDNISIKKRKSKRLNVQPKSHR
ncbi:hypothetical protein WA026_012471 [Henosepilachna vigintioctopunctata]|uniref:Uncharacterized protein n=1 Tax=Henosepilachna vigintioctopunctata TaxID=420089 RepID=A0AAW1V0T3_9CUCU